MSATETVMIEDLDQFVKALNSWHATKVQTLKHMQSIPEGSGVTLQDGTEKVMTGDMLTGFILGLTVALAEMGTLPFEAELEIVDPEVAERIKNKMH